MSRVQECEVGAAPRPRAGSVLYVLTFLPTYVQSEIGELHRRGVPVAIVLPAPWPRAVMWDHITGFAPSAPDGPAVYRLDFRQWLVKPIRALTRPAALLLAGVWRRCGRAALRLAARSVREGTFRHYLAAAWLFDVLTAVPAGVGGAVGEKAGRRPRARGGAVAIRRVHAHFAGDAAEVGAWLAQLLGVPFSVTTHANDIFVPSVPQRIPRLLAAAAPALTISQFNRGYLWSVVGPTIGTRVRVLYLGVDVDALPRWSPMAHGFTVVCIASGLVEKKGLAVLLDACAALQARGFRFRCQVCGADPGEQRLAALRRLVRARGLADVVTLLGALAWNEAQQLVAAANAFVLPAIRTPRGEMDGIPVSLIEAMGIGVPSISTRVSGIPELIDDGRNGLLVPPGDVRALADAIERVARDPALAQAMSVQARQRVREAFSLARAVDGLLAAWDEAAPSRAAPTIV
jgi:glycosyltransferase involved in cell wall biosynthesis